MHEFEFFPTKQNKILIQKEYLHFFIKRLFFSIKINTLFFLIRIFNFKFTNKRFQNITISTKYKSL